MKFQLVLQFEASGMRDFDDLVALKTVSYTHLKAAVANALVEPEERALSAQLSSVAPEVESLAAARRYAEALERIATLRPAVDAFFDKVMVMAPDAALRRNRLSLIAEVAGRFSSIADFSEIISS